LEIDKTAGHEKNENAVTCTKRNLKKLFRKIEEMGFRCLDRGELSRLFGHAKSKPYIPNATSIMVGLIPMKASLRI